MTIVRYDAFEEPKPPILGEPVYAVGGFDEDYASFLDRLTEVGYRPVGMAVLWMFFQFICKDDEDTMLAGHEVSIVEKKFKLGVPSIDTSRT